MKFSEAMLARQRTKDKSRRLPAFLSPRPGPICLDSAQIFPVNADSLFVLNDWNECSCLLRGLLFMWRLFFVLYHDRKYPGQPLSELFVDSHPMDVLRSTKLWLHEATSWSCEGCLPTIKNIFNLFAKPLLPRPYLFEWTSSRVRVAAYLGSSWDYMDIL